MDDIPVGRIEDVVRVPPPSQAELRPRPTVTGDSTLNILADLVVKPIGADASVATRDWRANRRRQGHDISKDEA